MADMQQTHSEVRISSTMALADFKRLKEVARARGLKATHLVRMVLLEYLDTEGAEVLERREKASREVA